MLTLHIVKSDVSVVYIGFYYYAFIIRNIYHSKTNSYGTPRYSTI